ncbi:MAG: type I-C CRISPR-associated protein Cas5 [Dehalococcoidia bacterium]|nr:MAG: type I-C CRISPR-associated protein Cas5 [Dehalococcoidia bacterium]
MNRLPPVEIKVWGDLACFTRPEMHVERVTYPVMTPSAARGVLEAIFWRPEMRWQVEEIHVLKPIQYFSIRRNEVQHRQTEGAARGWQRAGGIGGFDVSEDRTQRHTMALRDVAYVIRAQIEVLPDVEEDVAKYRDQFRRRVRGGRCFATPYLGCREFSAFFSEPVPRETPVALDGDLGRMLLRMEYAADGSGHAIPEFFDARLEQGVLHVPAGVSATVGEA